ncbi:hypothetical protein RvY_09685 [Ramazzottius varieornatus]|uniref:PHD-type domain-containing protein n=1 Tax=Ramazzottius varieornatus TaxID=947166 RepID=A0A1D1VCK8_RAMVA|nr:hypothetical protein RvY_09685 [Ramazzottius varieornatus]
MFAAKEPRFNVLAKASKNFPRKDKNDRGSSSKDRSKKNQKKDKQVGKGKKGSESSKEQSSKKRKRDTSADLHGSKSKKNKPSTSSDGKEKAGSRTALSSAERAERKKLKQQEYKKRWREKMKQDRAKLTNVWAKVFSVGEDMECPSLKPIPIVPKSLETLMPEKFIADGLFLMEFLRVFGNSVDKSGAFADMASMDLDLLYKILSSDSVDGELTQMLAFCCRAVLSTVPQQPVERENSVIYNSGFQQEGASVISSTMSRLGVSLHDLSITSLTVSEVVRLSLLVACVPVRASAIEARFDSAILRMLKSPGGSSLYGVIYGQSVFALSFERRLELIVQMLQSVMESDVIRGVLEVACAAVEESEKVLKVLKSLNDEAAKIRGKILVSKDRQEDRKEQRNDRFRQLLESYSRKRFLRSVEQPRTAIELMEDFRILNEGRKRRKLTEADVVSLGEAFEDYRLKVTAQIQTERDEVAARIKRNEHHFRLEAVGMDRHWFKYWLLPSANGLLIECTAREEVKECSKGCLCETVKAHQEEAKGSSTWWTLPNGEEDSLTTLCKNLLISGEREVALKRALEPYLQHERKSLEIGHHATTAPLVVPRVVPQLPSAEVWQHQLRDRLLATLRHFNNNLQKARLGGIAMEKEGQWMDEMRGVAFVAEPFEDMMAASPEIEVPASNEEKSLSLKREEVVVNGHSPRTVTDEADNEPQDVPVDELKVHLMSPKLLKRQKGGREVLDLVQREEVAEGGSEVQSSVGERAEENGQAIHSAPTPFNSQTTASVKRLVVGIDKLLSCISLRYIGKPLVSINDVEEKNTAQFQAWKKSLGACAFSLSEVALHLSVLESSILWGKSTVNANCKACRKRGDFNNMACCDRCERKFHLDCVIPPLQDIPVEWWVCPLCEPVPVFRGSRKARQTDIDYNDDNVQRSFPQNNEGHTAHNGYKASSRTSRPLAPRYKHDEEEEENSQEYEARRRRSARSKRVDYKELAEGTSSHQPQEDEEALPQVNGQQQDGQEMEVDDNVQVRNGEEQEDGGVQQELPDCYREKLAQDEEEEEDYDTASPVESEDSEYDPDDNGRPKWGKTHRKGNKR